MFRRTVLLAVLAIIAGTGDTFAQKPTKKDALQERARLFYRRAPPPMERAAVSSLAVVNESEPNDNAATAGAVSLGEQATGEVNPIADVDYWVFTATSGTILDIDVDASEFGSPLDPTLELFDTDGVTSLAFNDDFDGLDSRIQFTINVTGDYFIAIRAFADGGGPGQTYTINFNTITPGPGDPTTLFASGFVSPGGMAFDSEGNLFVGELGADRVSRIAPDGTASEFATGIPVPLGLAFDGFGELLVVSGDANVYKISSAGDPTVFITGLTSPFWLTAGPDGSIWVSDPGDETLRRYDAFGAFQQSVDVSSAGGALFVAFSPAGELHFVDSFFDAMYKLVAGQPVFVFAGSSPSSLEAFAFDVDGNMYVPSEGRSRVVLYDPDGVVLEDPFALGPMAPGAVAFGRDSDGTTNARLFASDFGTGSIWEMNPAGIPAPGWPITVGLLVIAEEALPDAVVGADYSAMLTVTDQSVTPTWSVISGALPPGISLDPATGTLGDFPTEAGTFAFRVRAESGSRFGEKNFSITVTEPTLAVGDVADRLLGIEGLLSPEEERFLDLLGNRNGVFDTGDFRAFLVATGALGSAAVLTDRTPLEGELYGSESKRGSQ